jgi:hypothetical protein
MSALGKALEESYRHNKERDQLKLVYQAIKLGLWPWNPGKITAWTEQEFSHRGPKLTFETELLPNLPFVGYPDVLRYDFDMMAFKLAEEAFKFYRYRPATPVDDHIVLGEE